jgi:hypothetical protein
MMRTSVETHGWADWAGPGRNTSGRGPATVVRMLYEHDQKAAAAGVNLIVE